MRFRIVLVILMSSSFPGQAKAEEVLFESGTLGETGITWQQALDGEVQGSSVDSQVFSGVRFELTEPVVISRIGGHFFSPHGGIFFGAIISTDNATDFPDTEDLSSPDVLASTLLTFPIHSAEVFANLDLSLDPGWYAIVYGSGLFGATGVGGMVLNNPDVGTPSYIAFQSSSVTGWNNLISPIFKQFRFTVEGHVIPEPSTLLLIITASLACMTQRKSRRE